MATRTDVYKFRLDGQMAFNSAEPATLKTAMDAYTELKSHAEKLGITLTFDEAKTARVKTE